MATAFWGLFWALDEMVTGRKKQSEGGNGGDGGGEAKGKRVQELYRKFRDECYGPIPEVDTKEAWERLVKGTLVVVDVRKQEEWRTSMIPGAMTKEEFELEVHKDQEKIGFLEGKDVCTYCTIGMRAGKYAKKLAGDLKGRGPKVLNLKGSILGWVHHGLPVARRLGETRHAGEEVVKEVHVNNPKFDLAPDEYEARWFGQSGGSLLARCGRALRRWASAAAIPIALGVALAYLGGWWGAKSGGH